MDALSSSKRVCHACGTNETSQWRYGRTESVLLCNACGIRWKRKNKSSTKERVKPGPKRSRPYPHELSDHSGHSTSSTSSGSRHHTPSNSPNLHRNASSTPSSGGLRKEDSARRHRASSKMDLDQLVSPSMESPKHRHRKASSGNSSPISIRNLLNHDQSHSSYPKNVPKLPYIN